MANSQAMGSPSNWGGYLLSISGGAQFPPNYIKFDTYNITPDIREEVKAYRDDYSRELFRITATGTKSKISFETIDNLSLAEAYQVQTFFHNAEVDHLQRKIAITYWNPEYFRYDSGFFYRPDLEFAIRDIVGGDITYKSFKVTLIEY